MLLLLLLQSVEKKQESDAKGIKDLIFKAISALVSFTLTFKVSSFHME
jgi:hypothetical protein